MKPIVFLSYVGKESEKEAEWIHWYLKDYLDWKVFNYRQATARGSGPTKTVLETELKDSDLFVQIVKKTLGERNPAISESPPLQWERDVFINHRDGDSGRCLFLSMGNGDKQVKEYLDEICKYTTTRFHSSIKSMLGEVMSFAEHRQARFDGLVGGVLDFRSGMELLKIKQDVKDNRLDPNNAILKQKHLYSSPYSAQLWIDLATHATSQLKHVYDRYPLDNNKARRSELRDFHDKTNKHLKEWFDEFMPSPRHELNVIILGGGDGIRELKTCQWITREFEIEQSNALLVDISVDLLSVAVKRFQEERDAGSKTSFAIIDIEQRPEAILEVRRRTMPRGPGVFIFLGPTLCNVAENAFLSDLCKFGMESGDMIFCEVLLCNKVEPKTAVSDKTNPRFEFITSPLLTLGKAPDRNNFYEEITADPGNKSQSKVWYYQEGEDKDRYNLATVKFMLPDYCKKSFEDAGFKVYGLVRDVYEPQSRHPVTMGYVIAAKK